MRAPIVKPLSAKFFLLSVLRKRAPASPAQSRQNGQKPTAHIEPQCMSPSAVQFRFLCGVSQHSDAQSEPSAAAGSDPAKNIHPNFWDFLAFIAQCDTLLLDYIYSEQGVRSYGSFGLSSKKHGKDHIAGADE